MCVFLFVLLFFVMLYCSCSPFAVRVRVWCSLLLLLTLFFVICSFFPAIASVIGLVVGCWFVVLWSCDCSSQLLLVLFLVLVLWYCSYSLFLCMLCVLVLCPWCCYSSL